MLRLYGAKLGYLLYHRISLLPRAHCMVFLSFGCAFVNILWLSKTAVPFFIIYFFFLQEPDFRGAERRVQRFPGTLSA